jgi:ubiquinol-cytochrome c reductase iron-sulfur subunit
VRGIGRALAALVLWLLGSRRREREREEQRERIVPRQPGNPGAELRVAVLLLLAAACAVGFIVFYASESVGGRTQWMGASLGLSFAFLAAALIIASKRLVPEEELEEEYPEPENPEVQEEVARIVQESGSRITRKGLIGGSAGVAAAAMGAALIAPAASLGPALNTSELQQAPWRRGRRLVDKDGRPWLAEDIGEAFYTAFPEGLDRAIPGAPLILVRVDPADLELPPERSGWAPEGIVAYSKVCTHAACAVSEFRNPKFAPVQPRPALVCPCHYSTFDPARAAEVIYGPAGRPLPQLPLAVDSSGVLVATGNLSAPPGPSWWGVRGPTRRFPEDRLE